MLPSKEIMAFPWRDCELFNKNRPAYAHRPQRGRAHSQAQRRVSSTTQKEAQEANLGIWSTGGLSQMGSSKRHGLKNMEKLCKKSMQ